MLINSKTNLKGLLPFLVISLLLNNLFAADIQKKHSINIKSHTKNTFMLDLDANEYVKGNYQLSSHVKSINLLDKNHNIIRNLYVKERLEDRFIFLVDKKGLYYIETVASKKAIKLELNIEKRIKKEKQVSSNIQKYLSPTLGKLKTKKDIDVFWEKTKKQGTPLIEKKDDDTYILTFLYEGAKDSVKILGAPVAEHIKMDRLKSSSIWYKSFEVPNGTRLSYQFAPDIPNIPGTKREKRVAILSTIQVDPYNKTPMVHSKNFDKYNKVSTVVLPNPKYKDWGVLKTKLKGTIESYLLKSKILKNERIIDVYKPYGYTKNKSYPVLFLFDGKKYQTKVNTPKILDNLIAHKKIPATIAVFISNPSSKSRATELPANKEFAKFMSSELLTWFKKNINKNTDSKWHILSGSSYGGLASMYTSYKYPNDFSKVLSMSGSFWWNQGENEPEWLTKELAKAKKLPLDIKLYAGIYETGHESIDILESNRHLRDVLNAKDYNVSYSEFMGGHDYLSWQVILADGLIHFLEDYER